MKTAVLIVIIILFIYACARPTYQKWCHRRRHYHMVNDMARDMRNEPEIAIAPPALTVQQAGPLQQDLAGNTTRPFYNTGWQNRLAAPTFSYWNADNNGLSAGVENITSAELCPNPHICNDCPKHHINENFSGGRISDAIESATDGIKNTFTSIGQFFGLGDKKETLTTLKWRPGDPDIPVVIDDVDTLSEPLAAEAVESPLYGWWGGRDPADTYSPSFPGDGGSPTIVIIPSVPEGYRKGKGTRRPAERNIDSAGVDWAGFVDDIESRLGPQQRQRHTISGSTRRW